MNFTVTLRLTESSPLWVRHDYITCMILPHIIFLAYYKYQCSAWQFFFTYMYNVSQGSNGIFVAFFGRPSATAIQGKKDSRLEPSGHFRIDQVRSKFDTALL